MSDHSLLLPLCASALLAFASIASVAVAAAVPIPLDCAWPAPSDIQCWPPNTYSDARSIMSVVTNAGVIAAAAAAAEQRRRAEEEEEMTPYSQPDLSQDWEFKILRSASGSFKKPEFLRQCLEEEARAGWVLVEKFDDARVRLKRPTTAKERDGKLDIDPYRIQVGASPNAVAMAIVGITLAISMGVLFVIVLLAASLR